MHAHHVTNLVYNIREHRLTVYKEHSRYTNQYADGLSYSMADEVCVLWRRKQCMDAQPVALTYVRCSWHRTPYAGCPRHAHHKMRLALSLMPWGTALMGVLRLTKGTVKQIWRNTQRTNGYSRYDTMVVQIHLCRQWGTLKQLISNPLNAPRSGEAKNPGL